VDSCASSQASRQYHRDGRVDDAVRPVFVLLDVQGHLPRGQHAGGQPGLVLPRDVGARDRKAHRQYHERATSQTVTGVDHIESNSFAGIGLIKIYFKESASTALAISQLSSVTSAIRNILPQGIAPPTILDFNATNVPIIDVVSTARR